MKIRRAIGWLLVLVVAVLSPMLLPSCTLIGLPVSGQVLDPQTGEPVPGVIVVGQWEGQLYEVVHGSTICFHVETAVTDDKGHYRLGPWVNLDWKALWPVFDHYVSVTAYKEGFEESPDTLPWPNKGLKHLKKFQGSPEERLGYVSKTLSQMSCGSDANQRKQLPRVYMALYKEALQLTGDNEDHETLKNMRYRMAVPWNPSENSLLPEEAEALFNRSVRPLIQ